MLDIKEAKCLEFTVQIYLRLKHIHDPPPYLFLFTPLSLNQLNQASL